MSGEDSRIVWKKMQLKKEKEIDIEWECGIQLQKQTI
jgi:hypothetical protein